jgi:protein-S-isoprenylcysteine O-methyltransferase Ste14
MHSPAVVRTLTLGIPLVLTWGLVVLRQRNRRLAAGAFLATAWAIPSILACHLVALHMGWWSYDATGGMFLGLPVDLWLGWALLWGAIPILALPRAPVWMIIAGLVWLDLVLMPASTPVVRLHSSWLIGEAVLVVFGLLPAQLLGRWTVSSVYLGLRTGAQVVLFASLSLWVLPTIILTNTGGTWDVLLKRPGWQLSLGLQLLGLPAALGTAAVLEFAQRGKGTPFPWDPAAHLVTTGPYAYVANPMQLSMSLILLGVGILTGSWAVALAALVAGAFGAGFAGWQESGDLAARFGDRWREYRRNVRNWLPRWRPYVQAGNNATLYFAATCVECSSVATWFACRQPLALELTPAEQFPGNVLPRRITYLAADGASYRGLAAIARALEHVNLGWAGVGWVVRMPVIAQVLQLVVDAVGGGPRELTVGQTAEHVGLR